MALTVVGCIHLIAERKAIGPVELCAILRRVKHWFVEQVWIASNQKALVSTIRVFTANLKVMKHALEHIHRRLQIKEESNISLLGHYTCLRTNQFMDGWQLALSTDHSYKHKTFTSFSCVSAYSYLLVQFNWQ